MRTMMVALGLCALAGPVAAQTVHKCTLDGKATSASAQLKAKRQAEALAVQCPA